MYNVQLNLFIWLIMKKKPFSLRKKKARGKMNQKQCMKIFFYF